MSIAESLSILGCTRPIWIDDFFEDSPSQFADTLLNSWEVALDCEFVELNSILKKVQFGAEGVREELITVLGGLGPERIAEVREKLLSQQAMGAASKELTQGGIEKVCALLGVADNDRWNFDVAESEIAQLCADGDENVSYVVDLNEAGGSPTRGLEILKLLWGSGSKGIAFILTHDAQVGEEAKTEGELRQKLIDDDLKHIPICVIAKGRLLDLEEDDQIVEALKVSIKRAGLRKSLSEVVMQAENFVGDAFRGAADGLLSIAPEQLEAHVFDRGYKEGVSDLHVVERILTAHISQEIRKFFGTDKDVSNSLRRLRALRSIKLQYDPGTPNEKLSEFRLAEIWESEELINSSLAPIACGDVFESDPYETSLEGVARRYILLAQPCDVALRPEEDRIASTAFFIPLKEYDAGKPDQRKTVLPCRIGGKPWSCDFRGAVSVRLAVLDFASFRKDGRVRLDPDQVAPDDLLPGQKRVFVRRTQAAAAALKANQDIKPNGLVHMGLQLSLDPPDSFKKFLYPVLAAAIPEQGQVHPALPLRLTWRLRRCGRIRMPYAAAYLDDYLKLLNRQAFDLDYMSPGFA
jgi:hypothetical protein